MKNFLYTIILLGAIQGIITSCLLYWSRKHTLSTRLLAIIIALITLPGIHIYFHYKGWFDINAFVLFIHDILPLVVLMPLGPLIFFYIRSLLEPDFKPGRKENLHFLPVIIDLLPKLVALIFYIGKTAGWSPLSRDRLAVLIDTYSQYADLPRWISMTVYILLSIRLLREHRQNQQGLAGYNSHLMNWLQLFTYLFLAFQGVWLLYLIPYVIPVYSEWLLNTVDWFPVYIPLSVLIYWLGIKGWLMAQTMNYQGKKAKLPLWPKESVSDAFALLQQCMERDLLYLNPELNLDKLSQHSGLSPKNISAVLNQYKDTNFNHFINGYRVEAFKHRLSMPGMEHLTIAGIAMECGFNSPATFQRTFKQYTGLSPTAFRKTLLPASKI
ncbi:MAG: helix-turn-helix transcriptional regulator [Rhizobacter sp.]|nr:helix-turn-helix transcriptional regulator [Ferruginibacter sp.]